MKDLQKENDELRSKLDKYEKSSCQTCYGAGTVLISPDDGMDCPECAQWLADIKAEAVIDELKCLSPIARNEFGEGVEEFLSKRICQLKYVKAKTS